MRSALRPTAALCALLMASTVALGESAMFWNDAGTGADASGSAAAPTPVAFGTYRGYLMPHDADWYGVSSARSGPVCVQSWVDAAPSGTATLRATQDAVREIYAPFDRSNVSLAIAGQGLASTSLGVANAMPDFNDQGVYRFQLSAASVGILADAGTGVDAGATRAGALPVSAGCLAGSLDPMLGTKDASDVLSFTAAPGEVVLLSFAPTTSMARLSVLDASGASMGVVDAGEMTSFSTATGGTYYLSTTATGVEPIDYLIGLVVGPPGGGCRPTCVELGP